MSEKPQQNVEMAEKGDQKLITTLNNLSLSHSSKFGCNKTNIMDSSTMPYSIKCRVNALKNIQREYFNLESEYYEEMSHIEQQFHHRVAPLLEKRKDLVSGLVTPTEEESKWEFEVEDEADEKDNIASQTEVDAKKEGGAEGDNLKGIPSFWFKALQNSSLTAEMIAPNDEEILEYLENITCSLHAAPARPGFRLDFFFKPNDFFTNSVLHKEYFIRFKPFDTDPLSYEGPEIVETRGCNIDWHTGRNVTVKLMKKKVKSKKNKQQKTINQTVKVDSFFNFFSPPLKNIENLYQLEEEDDDEALLHSDFELGQFFRECLIPKAVLYYTGEIVEEDCDVDDDFMMHSDDEDFDSDSEGHDDEEMAGGKRLPKHGSNSRGGGAGHTSGKAKGENPKPEECKQQ